MMKPVFKRRIGTDYGQRHEKESGEEKGSIVRPTNSLSGQSRSTNSCCFSIRSESRAAS